MIPERIVAEFSYDVLGRRISKQTLSSTILYIYSGDQIFQETETTNGVEKTKEYVYGNGGVDDIIASIQDNTIYYYHKDQIGSIVGITDGSGNLVNKYEYDVFGKARLVEGVDIGNTRLFTGREYDKEIELYYYRARYYDADLGRFISRDPIDTSDDVNLYGYVKNNPVNAVDPSGLMAKAAIMEAGDFIGITDASEGLGNVAAFWMGYATDDKVLMSEGEAGMRDSLGKLTNPVAFAMNRLNKMKKVGGVAMGLFGKKTEKYTTYDITKLYKTQPVSELEKSTVRNIVESIKNGSMDWTNKRVPVYIDNGKALLLDGHHRLEAAVRAGMDRIPVQFIQKERIKNFGRTLEQIKSFMYK